ncbi:MAG: GNAT family N-acetyltransferase [Cellulophaga sp.]
MKNNPFSSDNFTSIWLKHFHKAKKGIVFEFISDLLFIKHPKLPLFINVGKTLSKGIYYTLSSKISGDFKRKVFLIYDVPAYFNLNTSPKNNLKVHRIKQYKGFSVGINEHNDFNAYMSATFKKSSRYKLKKYKKRLELSFKITYKMFHGDISKTEYNHIFDSFKILLEKRFEEKCTSNNNLNPDEWNFYKEVAYPMLLEKKASLFVIYDDNVPIGVTLNYFSNSILFDAITVFDINYAKFHLGSITIMKLIEWSFENDIRTFDFSKGYFDYKKRWSNNTYNFEYHIYYDASSIKATGIAFGLKQLFKLKQSLREKNINDKLHLLTYSLKNKSSNKPIKTKHTLLDLEYNTDLRAFEKINPQTSKYDVLKTTLFDFLYLKQEKRYETEVFKVSDDTYIIKGQTNISKVFLHP